MASYFRIGVWQILNIVAFVAMIVVNGLADFLPINGQTTGQVSDQYPNLFTPAPVTFSIWLLIYSLLFLFCMYEGSTLFEDEKVTVDKKERVVEIIGYRFIVSCMLNIAWIIAWHYHLLLLSVIIMLGLLATLIGIFEKVHAAGTYAGRKARWFVYAPFSIYLGWISIAAIANITAWLVSIGWNGWNIAEWIWACIMIIVGTILAILMLLRRNNTFYALTVAWALLGIFLKQYSGAPSLNIIAITAVSAGALLLLLSLLKFRAGRLVYKH
jgi:translocator protein